MERRTGKWVNISVTCGREDQGKKKGEKDLAGGNVMFFCRIEVVRSGNELESRSGGGGVRTRGKLTKQGEGRASLKSWESKIDSFRRR